MQISRLLRKSLARLHEMSLRGRHASSDFELLASPGPCEAAGRGDRRLFCSRSTRNSYREPSVAFDLPATFVVVDHVSATRRRAPSGADALEVAGQEAHKWIDDRLREAHGLGDRESDDDVDEIMLAEVDDGE